MLIAILTPAVPLAWSAETDAASEPAPISTVGELWSVPENAKHRSHPLRLELVVNYYDPHWKLLWARDGQADVFVPLASAGARMRAGQRVLIEGSCIPAQGVPLAESKVTVLDQGVALEPQDARRAIEDSVRLNPHLVLVEGYVNRQLEIDPNHLHLELAVDGQPVVARVLVEDNRPLPRLERMVVRVTGVYAAAVDPASPLPQINLWVSGAENVTPVGRLERDFRFAGPVTPVEEIARADDSQLVHVVGTVHAHSPGTRLILRDDTGQVEVRTAMTAPLEVGAVAEAIGYPAVNGAMPILREALYRRAAGANAPAQATSSPPLLRMADQVRQLSAEAADEQYPVRLSGIVTWSHRTSRTFFLLDASGSIAVQLPIGEVSPPATATRVQVQGVSADGGFAPVIRADRITAGESVSLPEPRASTLEQAMTGVEEAQWISLGGYVRRISREGGWHRLELATVGGDFTALVAGEANVTALGGAVIRARGVCVAQTDSYRQLTDIQLWIGNQADIEVEEARPADPYAVPLRTIASLRQFSTLQANNRRVRIAGVVLQQDPGASLAVADGSHGLMVLSRDSIVVAPGDRIEAVGLPGRHGNRVVLREATFRKVGRDGEPNPHVRSAAGPLMPELDGRLVQLPGMLLNVSRQSEHWRLTCQSDATLFEALLPVEQRQEEPAWAVGSQLALTGVYRVEYDNYDRPRAVLLRLRTPADVKVVRAAPWLTLRRIALLAGAPLLLLAAFGWLAVVHYQRRRQVRTIRAPLDNAARLETESAPSGREWPVRDHSEP